jgi:hypothetical protein
MVVAFAITSLRRAFVFAMAKLAKGMDVLGELSSDSDSDSGASDKELTNQPAPRPTAAIDYESLKKHGMKSAPGLDGIREAGVGGNWGWSNGRATAGGARDDMSGATLHHATNAGLEEACAKSIKVAETKRRKKESDGETYRAEIASRRARERETRDALREDDKVTKRERSDKEPIEPKRVGEKNWELEEKKALRDAGRGFGFD